MQKPRVLRHIRGVYARDGRKAVFLAVRKTHSIAPARALVKRFARELPRDDICRLFPALCEVHRYHRELERRAALQKEHMVIVAYVHDAAQRSLRVRYYRREILGAVAHLHDAAAAALIIYQIALSLLKHLKRQHRRPRGKIQNTVHNIPPVGSL